MHQNLPEKSVARCDVSLYDFLEVVKRLIRNPQLWSNVRSRQPWAFLFHDIQVHNYVLEELPSAVQVVWASGWGPEVDLSYVRGLEHWDSLPWLDILESRVVYVPSSHLKFLREVGSLLELLVNHLGSLFLCGKVLVDPVCLWDLVDMVP